MSPRNYVTFLAIGFTAVGGILLATGQPGPGAIYLLLVAFPSWLYLIVTRRRMVKPAPQRLTAGEVLRIRRSRDDDDVLAARMHVPQEWIQQVRNRPGI